MVTGGMVLVGTVSKVLPAEERSWKDDKSGRERVWWTQSVFVQTPTQVFETVGEPIELHRGQPVALLVEVSTSAQGRLRVERAGSWEKADAEASMRQVYATAEK